MFRIDGAGAAVTLPTPAAVGTTVGYFTDGDPVNSIPASVVTADYMNMLMMEVVNVVTAAGLTPSKVTYTQLRDSITLINQAGSAVSTFTVVNNQSTPASVTGLLFDSTKYRAAEVNYELYRKDSTQELVNMGTIRAAYKPVLGAWLLLPTDSSGDDTGVDFNVTSGGQLQYVSSSMGSSYVGELRTKLRLFAI